MRVMDRKSDASRAKVMASAKGMKKSPASPPTKSSGRKTDTVVRVPVTSGPMMS
jgi:hypothetical protein